MEREVLLKDLNRGVMGIYQIDFPNGKIYIGLSIDIKRRMWEHNNPKKAKTPCDFAIIKYGRIEKIKILELIDDSDTLEERERYWINLKNSNNRNIGYNVTDGGDGTGMIGDKHYKSTMTNEEVIYIRKSKHEGARKIDVYKEFEDRVSFGSFEHVWLGATFQNVGMEYLNNIPKLTKEEHSSIANSGENNGMSKIDIDTVLRIRELYDSGMTVKEVKELFPNLKYGLVRRVCKRETWKSV